MTKTELERIAFWNGAINLRTGEVLEEGDPDSDDEDVYSADFLLRVLTFFDEE